MEIKENTVKSLLQETTQKAESFSWNLWHPPFRHFREEYVVISN